MADFISVFNAPHFILIFFIIELDVIAFELVYPLLQDGDFLFDDPDELTILLILLAEHDEILTLQLLLVLIGD